MTRQRIDFLLALLLAGTSVALGQEKNIYFAVGRPLEIEPRKLMDITSITWKSGADIVTEWIKGELEVLDFGDFKSRTTLNTNTGTLTIKTAKASDAGKFTVEINNRVQPEVYNAVLIQRVPVPEVHFKPLKCSKESERCTLSCEGNFDPPGLVSYFWRKESGDWEKGEKDKLIINDQETRSVQTFSCKVQNPVSENESRAEENRFYIPPQSHTVVIVIVVLLLLIIIIIGLVVGYLKREQLRKRFPWIPGKTSDGPQPDGNKTNEELQNLNKNPNSGPREDQDHLDCPDPGLQ